MLFNLASEQKLTNKSKPDEKYYEVAIVKMEKKVGKKYTEVNKDVVFASQGF